MFGFGKKSKFKTYQEEEFSFEYPSYMKVGLEGEMNVCFHKKKWPTGVLRMSRLIMEEQPTHEELIQTTKDTFEDDGVDNCEEIDYNGLKGIKYFVPKTFNHVDDFYWPGGQVAKFQDKLPQQSEIDWAIAVSNLMSMTMRYYQFGNDQVHFYFTYRHFFNQSEKTQKELDEELIAVEKIFRSIKFN